jgi:outer membrane protein assembly factor BamB
MKKTPLFALLLSGLCTLLALAGDWPQWRGPHLNGVSDEKNLPTKWSKEENITWKLAMPAWSGATPIISGNRIFLNVAEGDTLSLWCVDRKNGTPLWKRPLGGGNVKMRKQNMSSPSPVTDGKSVYVMTGTGILKGFDFEGKELWTREIQKDYGRFGLNWGYASSPLLYEDSLYVQVLHGMRTKDPSYILRIERKTGKTLWRVERPTQAIVESPDSYTTPQLLKRGSEMQLVVSGGDVVTGHDLATGKELWRGGGFNPTNNPNQRIIASPVVLDDVVMAPTRVRPLLAYRAPKGSEQPQLLWSFDHGPDVPTPVTDGKYFYSVDDRGIMWCLDVKTGAEVWSGQRLKSATYSSSPVLADGMLYITNEEGLTSVVRAGPKFEIISENPLGGYVLSSPAISDGQIFIRTDEFLYAIGKRNGG